MEVRPRRAAEAFWRCEQAFERRTRDMTFPPPLLLPPFLSLSGRVRDVGWMGAPLERSFVGFGVSWVYRFLMGTGWERPWSPAALEAESKGRLISCW